ncbi:DUF4386 domain-containing protein [Kineosporia babensis]|uniref:DUF4386 domain-containing protein n=1 Tax=Kineosporia babensis TaxID=499548 RepID=A0A9X1SSK3_9ACTN|nr:DUF4386 domain-containing protein [Kineosporia babensis]MCD5310674.1 DUF4386 domain-containing protein [Kineosporia babensis]
MHPIVRTARITGLLYLGIVFTGIGFYFLLLPELFAADKPGLTMANLTQHEGLARAIVAVELLMVIVQTLTAVWFYLLFRPATPSAAAGIAAFGLVNAVVALVSAGLLATALQISLDPFGDATFTAHTLYLISDNIWDVGALFFGLWLIPMGWCVLRSGWMPAALGWILVAGGVGYILSAFVRYLLPDADLVAEALAYPATVGEFWMVGYLLIHGVRRRALGQVSVSPAAPAPTTA